MNDWGPATYGQPCRECAFDWTLSLDDAAPSMSALATAYEDLLRGATGREQHPDLSWSSAAYVSHVADNLRIWTERLHGSGVGGTAPCGQLRRERAGRGQELRDDPAAGGHVVVAALDHRVGQGGRRLAPQKGTVLIHPERGEMDLLDVVAATTHDAHHHLWDIERTLQWED